MTETRREAVLRVLEDGPGTAREIGAELGITPRLASAHLCCLMHQGLVEHGAEMIPAENINGKRVRDAFTYRLKTR